MRHIKSSENANKMPRFNSSVLLCCHGEYLSKPRGFGSKYGIYGVFYKIRSLSKEPITSSNENLAKAKRWVWLLFLLSVAPPLYFHTCAATCCVGCVSLPRERVMRTAGARLNNRGSLTEKWAGAPTLPAASERQSRSSAWQPRNLQPALKDSSTCIGNFMPWHPDQRRPTATSSQNTEMHAVGVENTRDLHASVCSQKLLKANSTTPKKTQDVDYFDRKWRCVHLLFQGTVFTRDQNEMQNTSTFIKKTKNKIPK